MAAKKNIADTSASAVDPVALCEAVAAKIDVITVRLEESVARYHRPVEGATLNSRYRARFARLDDEDRLQVRVDFGIEETESAGDAGSDASAATTEETPRLLIEAGFVMVYALPNASEFGDDHLQAFASFNAPYHAWPFWRELVYSTMARMGLPPITLPVFRVGDGPAGTETHPIQDD